MTNHITSPDNDQSPPEPFRADFSEGLETGLYLALLELIDEGVVITGDETIIEVNSAACRLLERDYRALAGQALSVLFPSEKAFLDARARLFIQGQMRGGLQVALPGGRRRDLRFVAAARIRPGIHALVLSPDIIAEAYSDQPSRDTVWPQLAAVMMQGIVVIDPDGRVTAANAEAQRQLQMSARQLIDRSIDAIFHIHYLSTGRAPRVSLLNVGNQETLSGRMLDGPKPGGRLLVLDAPDQATHAETKPKAVSSAAKVAPSPGSSLIIEAFGASPLPTLLFAADGLRILDANTAATRLFGYSAEALKRLTLGALRADAVEQATTSGNWRFRQHNGAVFECHAINWSLGDATTPRAFALTLAWPATPVRIVPRRQRKA